MRLAAVYLPEHRLFDEDKTINFGGEYFYHFDRLADDEKGLFFSIHRNQNYNFIDDFFGKDISMVSAIIGSNGSGKTSILSELKSNSDIFCVYEVEDRILLIRNEFRSEVKSGWYELKFDDSDNVVIDIFKVGTTPYDIPREADKFFYSARVSYYNPLAYTNSYLTRLNVIREEFVSVNELQVLRLKRNLYFLSNDILIQKIIKLYPDFPRFTKAEVFSSALSDDEFLEIELFLLNDKSKKEYSKEYKKEQLEDAINKGFHIPKIYQLCQYSDSFIKGVKYDIAEKLFVLAHIMLSIELKKTSNHNIDEEIYQIEIKSNFKEENLIIWLERLRELLKEKFLNILKKTIVFIDESLNWYKMLPGNLSKNENTINADDLSSLIENDFFVFQNKFENDFKNLNLKLLRDIDFTLCYFKPAYPLSQGEESLLNLFSTFNSNHIFEENRLQIILLDEATVGFHPQWQKKFVKALVDVLPLIFESKISRKGGDPIEQQPIQIIFTSHDPLSLSDIPSSNITYIKKDKSTDKTLLYDIGKEDRPQKSFGANIHELLSHSFFIEDGLIGDFAKDKINDTIRWLNYEKLSKEILNWDKDRIVSKEEKDDKIEKLAYLREEIREWDEKKHISLITIIDEPILQTKLIEMYSEVFGEFDSDQYKENIKEQIEKLAQGIGYEIKLNKKEE
ncbi:hypothetical protein J8L88_05780 [Aquimarina sp. MMG015]|uniref:hypothetical protein n=1 Tax=Aquimarina sp. MMG015 TaxID=2822689 RepID=UPI001B3A4B68|nr:hypothetical protein [Aquimarina sp. MMG015]MBQ4802360.1 hypothetical protein [Aquimarina sp. MMG015]